MSGLDYVISVDVLDRHDSLGLKKGVHYWRARTERDGAYRAFKTQVIEPRDADGKLCGDIQYLVEIDGESIPFEKWHGKTYIGDEITETQYKTMLVDGPWTERNYGVRPGQKTDIRKMPFVTP